jgi:ABC-type multidrug transport system ATPase subunit
LRDYEGENTGNGSSLTVITGGREFNLEGEGPFTLGRAAEADIHIDHAHVSDVHAVLEHEGGRWVLRDCSGGGTFFARKRVDRLPILAQLVVRLGDAEHGPSLVLQPVARDSVVTQHAPTSASATHQKLSVERHERISGTYSGAYGAAGLNVRIGRAADNDIVLDDLLVSRHHCELQGRPDGGYELVDLGSSNGTFVNGRQVRRIRLEQLDLVAIGHHLFRLVGSQLEGYVDEGLVTFQAVELSVRIPDGRTVLDEVTFSLEESSFLAVVGPSGAGKTTLLNALTGFRPAQRGTVLYGGRNLYENYGELCLRIGFVPQENVVHTALTVRQALRYAAELRFSDDVDRDDRARRTEEVIRDLGLEAVGNRSIQNLSGGQRRRVAVAAELMTRPSLLFLDEPASGLDPGYERTLMTLLRELADGGRSVVVVTHSVQSIRLCDRVLFLAPGGRLAYFGPPQLALAYFGCEDFQQLFYELSTNEDKDWTASFRAHPDHDRFIEQRLLAPTHEQRSDHKRVALPSPRSWLSQSGLLTRRYAQVILADRRNLVFLLLQPIVLGLLMLAALPAHELTAPAIGEVRTISRASFVLLIVILGTTWLGASNAAREIVRELSIIRRERAVGLSISAYISSKVVVLGLLTVGQSTLLVPIALARQGSHDGGSVLSSPLLELTLAGALTGLAAVGLGLLISSLVSTVDRAMLILPVVLILELLLATGGVIPDVVEKPVLKQGSYLASTQWGFSATASTVDLDRIQAVDRVAREAPTIRLDSPLSEFRPISQSLQGEQRWNHEPHTWLWNAGALVALSCVGTLGAGLALRRR